MKTTIRTSSNEFKEIIKRYFISCVDFSDYDDNTPNTEKEKLNEVYNTFLKEFWHDENKRYYSNNKYTAFADWLAGLPSCFTIDFTYYDILRLGREWNTIPEYMTEKKEDDICQNWFKFITLHFFRTLEKINK